ncbi:MAG: hypothetical protein PHN74_00630 [Candidatus Pacebacteria bacterium]|nr:hypothetical protein [Candidatus Paceibacterota bacterium]
MTKLLLKTLFVFAVINPGSFNLAIAADSQQDGTAVSKPLLLPTNPLYFLKEWKRETQKAFTFNQNKKIDLDINTVNEKIIELIKLDNIKSEFVSAKITKKMETLEQEIVDLGVQILSKTESASLFHDRIIKMFGDFNNYFRNELRAAEILYRIKNQLSEDYGNRVGGFEERFLISFGNETENSDFLKNIPNVLNQLILGKREKINFIDELREAFAEGDVKNVLGMTRQEILEKASEDGNINKPDAQNMIDGAEKAVENLADKMKERAMPKSNLIKDLYSKASFNLTEAKNMLQIFNDKEAFSQASIAEAAAKTALVQIVKIKSDESFSFKQDIKDIKGEYDALINTVNSKDLNAEKAPYLFDILTQNEKLLVKLSDILNKGSKFDFDVMVMAVRQTKSLFFKAEQELENFN